MSFSELFAPLDSLLISTFGDDLQAVIHFPVTSGFPDVVLSVIVKNPVLEEDFLPGSTQGTSSLLLFGHAIDQPLPNIELHGCTVTVGGSSVLGADYDLLEGKLDRVGGLTMKLRRRNKAWNA